MTYTPEQLAKRKQVWDLWYAKNAERIRERRRQRNASEEGKAYARAYYQANRARCLSHGKTERSREYRKRYYQAHKIQSRERQKELLKCPERRRKWAARKVERARELYRENPDARIRSNHRTRLKFAVKAGKKCAKTMILLGCSIPELKLHLESGFRDGMNWGNYGPHWHIDHKRPCASFDLTDPEQQRICFHFSNLQPLLARENMLKGDTWEKN